ncbi:metallophosphoesterase family protein [Tissierella sp.]|uniref:metallophosphoesterase family protein n=1 Tax=Tissierella sp. TaxID=41274 RepID=UPI002858EF67|nr:metallophosphoesterase family protein [Tissierella sp.]MDR7857781.1 metallophosphoesterase family protein [Tissierella sp.]
MKYVTSDIHGRLDRLKKLIDEIGLNENDTLYIIGDLVDRGSEPIETIEFVMDHPQIEVIMGNHDEMFLQSLKYEDEVQIERWGRNGCSPTIDGFFNRTVEEQDKILDYISELPYFKIIDGKYLLVHAGFEPLRLFADMENMSLEEALMEQKHRLVWVRDDFIKNKALDNLITIFGHSPRKYIDKCFDRGSLLPYEIWFDDIYNDKIGVDTGNCYENGRMACLRLDDYKVFYIE